MMDTGEEFNITLDLEVQQQGFRPNERDRRVGQAVVTFHVTPKSQLKTKKQARKARYGVLAGPGALRR